MLSDQMWFADFEHKNLQQYALIYLTSSGTQLCLYIWVYPFRLEFFNQSQKITMILLISPIKIYGKAVSKSLWVMIGNWSINSWMYVRGIQSNWMKLLSKCNLGETWVGWIVIWVKRSIGWNVIGWNCYFT